MLGFRNYVRRHHVGLLALFVALGGTAYAAVELERNEVKSRHIGPGQVKRSDIARNAVNSRKVANGSLLRTDFAAGEVPAGATGAAGVTGQTGPTGPTGPAGLTMGASEYEGDSLSTAACNDTTLRSETVNLTAPSKILAIGQARVIRSAGQDAALQITAHSGTAQVAFVERYYSANQDAMTAVGLLKSGFPDTEAHTFAPGTYTVRLEGSNAGNCSGTVDYVWSTLDYVVLGSG
jgi:hypothetical protein